MSKSEGYSFTIEETKDDVRFLRAHNACRGNRDALEHDSLCGCFHCLSIFSPEKIFQWVGRKGDMALCPYCGIDAVLPESSGFPISMDFLYDMQQIWFDEAFCHRNDKVAVLGRGEAGYTVEIWGRTGTLPAACVELLPETGEGGVRYGRAIATLYYRSMEDADADRDPQQRPRNLRVACGEPMKKWYDDMLEIDLLLHGKSE